MSPRRETLLHGSLGGGLEIDGKHTYRRAWRNGLSGHSPGVGVGQGSVLPKLDRDLLSKAAEISPQARGKGEPASTGTRRGLVHVGQDGRQLGHHRPEAKVAVRASSLEFDTKWCKALIRIARGLKIATTAGSVARVW